MIRKALNGVICLLKVFSHIRLRRCCKLLSSIRELKIKSNRKPVM